MKLLWHLLATDLRQFRWVLGAWMLVVALTAAVYAIPSPSDFDLAGASPIAAARGLFSLTQALLLLVIAPLVMQAHPAVGNDAFWMTRPLPPRTLVASKLGLLGGVTLIPIAATAALMTAYQVSARHIAFVSLETAALCALLVLVLMVFAAWTPDFWRFALVCLSIVATIAAVLTIAAIVLFGRMDEAPSPDVDVGVSGGVFSVLIAATALAASIIQYRTRNRRASIAAGVLGVCLAAGIDAMWPWHPLQPRASLPEWADDQAIAVAPDVATIETQPAYSFGGRAKWRTVTARVGIRGVPAGWSAHTSLFDASLDLGETTLAGRWSRYPSTSTFAIGQVLPGMVSMPSDGRSQQLLSGLLDVRRVLDADLGFSESTTIFFVRDEDFGRHAPAVGHYRGRFWVSFTRHDLEAVLPLRPGAVHTRDSYRLVVDRVERTSTGLAVMVRQSEARSTFDRQIYSGFGLYLRNRQRGEAVLATADVVRGDFFLQRLLPFGISIESGPITTGFSIHRIVTEFPARHGYGRPRSQPILDNNWVAGAELVILRSTPAGAVQRTVDIPEFPFREASPAARDLAPAF